MARKGADVLLVSAADKLDNARAIVTDLRVQGEDLWSRFGAGREVLWYYRALVDAFRARVRELGEGREPGLAALVQELALTVDTMERMAESNAG
ncbi:MAG: hypothetical protein MUF56_02670 [Solirubrobacteraceae bacterium]|nr:hypothetical protein [Solirubrobacteraceae bacterium]